MIRAALALADYFLLMEHNGLEKGKGPAVRRTALFRPRN